MITAGVILDPQDDPHGLVLREAFGSPRSYPQFFQKTAAAEDVSQLPDEAFALILTDQGRRLRKYAMHSPEACQKSATYFMLCGARLPEEAQKVAAYNLAQTLFHYDIRPPVQMLKLAQAAMNDRMGRTVEPATTRQAIQNRTKTAQVGNEADTTHRFPAPILLEQQRPTSAKDFALVKEGQGMYPINTLDRLTNAVEYFEKNSHRFDPMDRRQYCVKVASRIVELGLPMPKSISKYAHLKVDPAQVSVALTKRAEALPHGDPHLPALDALAKEAAAALRYPETLMRLFAQFDKTAGLDRFWDVPFGGIPNPVFSVCREKTAAEEVHDDMLWEEGNDRLSGRELRGFLRGGKARWMLEEIMDVRQVDEFMKNPWEIFQSLPVPQKVQIARMAADNSDGRDLPHTRQQTN